MLAFVEGDYLNYSIIIIIIIIIPTQGKNQHLWSHGQQ